jgi:ABC-2 type transport system permease protein
VSSQFDSSPFGISGSLLTFERESKVFWWLRTRLVIGSVRRMLRVSRLRLTLVLVLSLMFWAALFFLFYSGFELLAVIHEPIIESLYNAFFASLMVMLVFSSAIIMYSSLYRSPEAVLLLTMPARTDRIFAYLFHEAFWFGSWGFWLIGSPMMVASGIVLKAPWYYFAFLPPFMLAFVFIPATLGGILCLLVVDRLGRIRKLAVRVGAVLLAIAVIWLGWNIFTGTKSDLMTPHWFQELSDRLRFTENRLLPSWWLSTGLLEATRRPAINTVDDHPWAQSVMFLVLLISNALFLHQLAAGLAHRVYRSSFSRMQGERTAKRRAGTIWLDRLFLGNRSKPPSPLRLLLLKEVRLFRRDPVQWSQCLIFFGLLALYFVNIRRFSYNPGYSAMIGFLNLAVVGLILSTFTTRFIFPMVSLEGQRFWILSLLPVKRDVILLTKFAFAAIASLVPCCALMFLSDRMLDIRLEILLVHQFSCAILCLGLAAIAVGLGARLPDLRERSPSKIAAGFGGTLTLVVSAIYIVTVVMLTAVPYHFRVILEKTPAESFFGRLLPMLGGPLASRIGIGLTGVLGIIAIFWPLYIGLRAFRKLDP